MQPSKARLRLFPIYPKHLGQWVHPRTQSKDEINRSQVWVVSPSTAAGYDWGERRRNSRWHGFGKLVKPADIQVVWSGPWQHADWVSSARRSNSSTRHKEPAGKNCVHQSNPVLRRAITNPRPGQPKTWPWKATTDLPVLTCCWRIAVALVSTEKQKAKR